MSQVTEQSVRFQTALASIKLIQASAVLDLTEDDFDFLTSNKVWIATDRSRDRKSGSAGMPRPISYAVFCLKKKKTRRHFGPAYLPQRRQKYHLHRSRCALPPSVHLSNAALRY